MSEQRKRFEAAMGAKLDLEPIEYADGSFHYYATDKAQVAWEAWQKACPDNWQAVPDVANDEMLEEGVESLKRGQKLFGDNLTQIVSNIHEDMLSAAPKPEDVCK